MESTVHVPVTGQQVRAKECPKCGRKNAPGAYMVREQDGRHIFKCDICGQKRSMGWTEASHLLMLDEQKDHERAFENRDRWRREFGEKYNEDVAAATEELQTPQDAVENFNEMMRGPKLDSSKEPEQDADEDDE